MIPRVLHRIWLGGDMPPELVAFGATWREHHPDWEHMLWTEDTLPPLRNRRLFRFAEEVTSGSPWQLRSDIARYEILLEHGGVYVDCDFECLRPLDSLLGGVGCFAAWETRNVWVNNAIMGALPGHPFVARLVAALPASAVRYQGRRPNIISGPQLVTRLYRADVGGLTVFDEALFYPYSFRELERKGEEFPDAFAVHHWNNRRRQRVRG